MTNEIKAIKEKIETLRNIHQQGSDLFNASLFEDLLNLIISLEKRIKDTERKSHSVWL